MVLGKKDPGMSDEPTSKIQPTGEPAQRSSSDAILPWG